MPMTKLRLFLLPILIACIGASPAAAESLVSLMGWPYIADAPGLWYAAQSPNSTVSIPRRISQLVYPVIGFPALVENGDEFQIVFFHNNGGTYLEPGDWHVRLTTQFESGTDHQVQFGDAVAQHHDPPVTDVFYDQDTWTYRLTCEMPMDVPADTFALSVATPDMQDLQPAAVRVLKPNGAFTFVHLANIKLSDPYATDEANDLAGLFPGATEGRRTAALFRNEIRRELPLWRPDFAVLGGDLVWGGNLPDEIGTLSRILPDTQVPLFTIPGNHDGYAFYNGDVLKEDGREFFHRNFGPSYFSFDAGDLHLVMINSYDGVSGRRKAARLILALPADNKGGFVGETQLAWLEADLADAEAAGKTIVMFAHHDPRGPYAPNQPFGTDPWNTYEDEAWNFESAAWDANPNDGIQAESRRHNTGVRLLRLALDHGASHLFIANTHNDGLWSFDAGDAITDRDDALVGDLVASAPFTIVQTTAAAAGVSETTGQRQYNGYRLVSVADGAITSTEYLAGALASVPAGNLWSRPLNNDGTATSVDIAVTNGLPRAEEVTLEFYLAGLPQGYEFWLDGQPTELTASDVAAGEGGAVVMYLKAEVEGVGARFPVTDGTETQTIVSARPHPTNQPPVAQFTATATDDPLTWEFDAAGTADPDGDALHSFWDFGDGRVSSGQRATHRYANGGEVYVTLTVLDGHGGRDVAESLLDVPEIDLDTDHDDDEDLCGECGATGGATDLPGAALLASLLFVLVFWGIRSKRRETR